MMIRKKLRRLLTLRTQEEDIRLEYERVRAMVSGLSAIRYDKDPVQTSNFRDMSDAIDELKEVEAQLIKVSRQLASEKFSVCMLLLTLENRGEYEALYQRYVCGRSVNDIADCVLGKEVTPEWIRTLMSRGIKNLEKK